MPCISTCSFVVFRKMEQQNDKYCKFLWIYGWYLSINLYWIISFLKKNWFIHDLKTFWSDGHFAKRYLVLNIRFVVSYAFNTFLLYWYITDWTISKIFSCHNLLIKLNSFYWRINFLIILFYFNKFQVFAYINHFWISIIRIETCRYNME